VDLAEIPWVCNPVRGRPDTLGVQVFEARALVAPEDRRSAASTFGRRACVWAAAAAFNQPCASGDWPPPE
jgi:hypothetical protein